jgi:hypothetical protein
MELGYIIILLVTGVGVGFAGGLLGVGGCFIMTPVQFWVYTAMDVPTGIAIKVAFGTNLLVVLPTAMSGAWRHHRKGMVWWRATLVLGGCGMLGALGGATIASHLPGEALKIAFGSVILTGGIRMLTARPPKVAEESKDNPWLWAAWGIPMGIITGLIGIGGGVLMVPVMVLMLKLKMHQAVGTSTAVMILTSLGGLIGYIVNGLGVTGIPSPHIGYVHIWSWLALASTSIAMVQVGAVTAHKLPARELRWIFIAVMFYMGIKMIGIFDWLNLLL